MQSVTSCNCCGGTRFRPVYRQPDILFGNDEWFDVVECADCGLGFVNPRPSPEEIGGYYPTDFYTGFDADEHRARYARQASFLPAVPPGGTPPLLLDVGCAKGHFPRFMRERGWQVEGLEISANTGASYDFPLYTDPLDRIAVEDGRYDAITAWAVIEHVHDPDAYFRAVGRLLKPGGRFVFLVTNFKSLTSRALFREDVPRHLYFFTEPCLGTYLTRAGMTMDAVHHDNTIFALQPANILYYALARLRGRQLRWEDIPEPRTAWLESRNLPATAGNTLRYLLAHPTAIADRALAVAFARVQLMLRSYGIIVVTATKPG